MKSTLTHRIILYGDLASRIRSRRERKRSSVGDNGEAAILHGGRLNISHYRSARRGERKRLLLRLRRLVEIQRRRLDRKLGFGFVNQRGGILCAGDKGAVTSGEKRADQGANYSNC